VAGLLHLEVVTPNRLVVDDHVEAVIVPGEDGELGILYNHTPLVAALTIGIMRYGQKNGPKKVVAITGGFVEVVDNKVTVLADAAELAEEIDVLRAEAAKERAERRLRRYSEGIDFDRAQLALRRAINRLRAARSEK